MWAAKCGAEVKALDFRPKTASGFAAMEKITGLTFDFHVGNILDPPNLGTFDAVFFLGVLSTCRTRFAGSGPAAGIVRPARDCSWNHGSPIPLPAMNR